MKDINSRIIYVGKAKNLKNRVRSYFKSSHEGKTAKLVSEIRDFETIITSTDKEAFLLEITLIQKHKPYYNIKLKRGTGYPYIKITHEKDPQLKIVSQVKKDGGYYFGPYPNVYAATETLQLLQKVYPLRRCNGYQKRPCLYYHMGQCLGACFKEVPQSEYEKQIKKIKSFLNGNVSKIKKELEQKMETASENLEFERAAEIRDQIHYVEMTVEKQKIISNDNTPRDLFAFYMNKGWLSLQIFSIRQARLMKREKRLFPCIDTPEAELESFILQFYNQKNRILPKEILVPSGMDKETLSEILGIPVKTQQRGQKRDLLEMAQVYQFGPLKTFRAITLPHVLPYLHGAAKSAIGLGFKSAVAAEVITRPVYAMGSRLYESKLYLEVPELFAWTMVILLLSVGTEKMYGFWVSHTAWAKRGLLTGGIHERNGSVWPKGSAFWFFFTNIIIVHIIIIAYQLI